MQKKKKNGGAVTTLHVGWRNGARGQIPVFNFSLQNLKIVQKLIQQRRNPITTFCTSITIKIY